MQSCTSMYTYMPNWVRQDSEPSTKMQEPLTQQQPCIHSFACALINKELREHIRLAWQFRNFSICHRPPMQNTPDLFPWFCWGSNHWWWWPNHIYIYIGKNLILFFQTYLNFKFVIYLFNSGGRTTTCMCTCFPLFFRWCLRTKLSYHEITLASWSSWPLDMYKKKSYPSCHHPQLDE